MNNDELQSANKGEWSELYVLFKIFSARSIPAADSELQPAPGKTYEFLKIFREEVRGVETTYDLSNLNEVLILDDSKNVLKRVSTNKLENRAKEIFKQIKDSRATFHVEDIRRLMDDFLITKIKANSSEKTDLVALLKDQTNISSEKIGFSIKSHVGGAPTLINSSGQTNFIFEIAGFNGNIDEVNSLDNPSTKVRDRMQAIYKAGGKFKFTSISSDTFTTNLRFTDTNFPQLLANMLLDFYSGKGNSLSELSRLAAKNTHLGFSEDEIIYKTKGFLRSSALGMVPSKVWNTRLSTYGGYIVVLDDGSLLCYSLLKDDDFKDYLFNNTKFDTPSTTKYDYAYLFQENDRLFMKLNLQIRFKK